MSEERSICSHIYNVCVTLDSGHECSLHECGVEMVPFLVVAAVACIFACEYLRSGAWIAVVAVGILLEETLSCIVVLVYKLDVHCAHCCPKVVKPFSASVWS